MSAAEFGGACDHDGGKMCPPRTPNCDCRLNAEIKDLRAERDRLIASVVTERDVLAAERDALRAQLAAAHTTNRVVDGEARRFQIERDAARADVDTLLEAIATFLACAPGSIFDIDPPPDAERRALYAAANALYAAANTIRGPRRMTPRG
jgi:septal ring factor EnvC (AmiA/AmiB activator)